MKATGQIIESGDALRKTYPVYCEWEECNKYKDINKVQRQCCEASRVGSPTMVNQKAVSHSARPCRDWTLRYFDFICDLRSRERGFLQLVAERAHRSCLDPGAFVIPGEI